MTAGLYRQTKIALLVMRESARRERLVVPVPEPDGPGAVLAQVEVIAAAAQEVASIEVAGAPVGRGQVREEPEAVLAPRRQARVYEVGAGSAAHRAWVHWSALLRK